MLETTVILIVEFHFNRVRVLHSTFVKERKTQTAMAQSKVLEKNLRILVEKLKTSHQSVLVAMKTMCWAVLETLRDTIISTGI